MSEAPSPSSSATWNAGAWFGTTLGSTLWLLIAAVVLTPHSGAVAANVLACFVVPNAYAAFLWRRRAERSFFAAARGFVLLVGLCSFVAVYVVDRAGLWQTLSIPPSSAPRVAAMYWSIAIVVGALWMMFHVMERARTRM